MQWVQLRSSHSSDVCMCVVGRLLAIDKPNPSSDPTRQEDEKAKAGLKVGQEEEEKDDEEEKEAKEQQALKE